MAPEEESALDRCSASRAQFPGCASCRVARPRGKVRGQGPPKASALPSGKRGSRVTVPTMCTEAPGHAERHLVQDCHAQLGSCSVLKDGPWLPCHAPCPDCQSEDSVSLCLDALDALQLEPQSGCCLQKWGTHARKAEHSPETGFLLGAVDIMGQGPRWESCVLQP